MHLPVLFAFRLLVVADNFLRFIGGTLFHFLMCTALLFQSLLTSPYIFGFYGLLSKYSQCNSATLILIQLNIIIFVMTFKSGYKLIAFCSSLHYCNTFLL